MTNEKGDTIGFDSVVKTLARTYNWPPSDIGGLFFDRMDYLGILYWFDDAMDMDKQMKTQIPKK